jgi:hypothetical protein
MSVCVIIYVQSQLVNQACNPLQFVTGHADFMKKRAGISASITFSWACPPSHPQRRHGPPFWFFSQHMSISFRSTIVAQGIMRKVSKYVLYQPSEAGNLLHCCALFHWPFYSGPHQKLAAWRSPLDHLSSKVAVGSLRAWCWKRRSSGDSCHELGRDVLKFLSCSLQKVHNLYSF